VAVLAILNYKSMRMEITAARVLMMSCHVCETKKRPNSPNQNNKECKKARKRLRGFIGNPFATIEKDSIFYYSRLSKSTRWPFSCGNVSKAAAM